MDSGPDPDDDDDDDDAGDLAIEHNTTNRDPTETSRRLTAQDRSERRMLMAKYFRTLHQTLMQMLLQCKAQCGLVSLSSCENQADNLCERWESEIAPLCSNNCRKFYQLLKTRSQNISKFNV